MHTTRFDSARNFDPEKHFDTPAPLLGRRFNRPTKSTIRNAAVGVESKESAVVCMGWLIAVNVFV